MRLFQQKSMWIKLCQKTNNLRSLLLVEIALILALLIDTAVVNLSILFKIIKKKFDQYIQIIIEIKCLDYICRIFSPKVFNQSSLLNKIQNYEVNLICDSCFWFRCAMFEDWLHS